jgi:hypothetical protein
MFTSTEEDPNNTDSSLQSQLRSIQSGLSENLFLVLTYEDVEGSDRGAQRVHI